MRVKEILNGVTYSSSDELSGLDIKNVTCDSRLVRKGDMFVAIRGHAANGRNFIDDAARKGARAILAEENFNSPEGIKKILVYDTRASLPVMAGNFYGHPSKKMRTIGVTGTNGKTTITYILESIVKACGKKTGVIGTVNYRLNGKVLPSKNTTPGPLELQSMLSEMSKGGSDYVVMEVSSHALDQKRVDCVSFDAGIFTNITSEHLDYHKTIENYFAAKSRLFHNLKEGGSAILNNDDRKVTSLRKNITKNVITYGIKEGADVRAKDISLSLEGSGFVALTPGGSFPVRTRLIGMHNVSNILASIAASLALGMSLKAIKKGVESVDAVPGRLERIEAGQSFKVFVDYAHTEDALYNILSLLKKTAASRIITVFGCGGNRDKQKRPLMGKVACRFSDYVVVTSDNPRFEDPASIVEDITGGIKETFSNYSVVMDRRRAIEKALRYAAHGDVVVIAGKGHEDYQIIKEKAIPFDDRKIAGEILKELLAKETRK